MYDDHIHKWFMFKESTVFEPYAKTKKDEEQLYVKVDYATLACNCGNAIRVRIGKSGE